MSCIHFVVVAVLVIFFCACNFDNALKSMNTNENYDIGKYRLSVRTNDERLCIEAINNFSLEMYWSDFITEQDARNISHGLFSNSLPTLSELVQDALDRKNMDIKLKLEVWIYIVPTKSCTGK